MNPMAACVWNIINIDVFVRCFLLLLSLVSILGPRDHLVTSFWEVCGHLEEHFGGF